jgi:hypothetical protein
LAYVLAPGYTGNEKRSLRVSISMKHGLPVLLSVCAASALHAQRGGLPTQFTKAGDTTVARVSGPVPGNALKRLVEVLRIQPTEDDTAMYSQMYDFVVDRQGRAWAYDDDDDAVYLFAANGRLQRKIGRKGGGPGEFQGNDGMAFMRDGRFAQLDMRNGRLSFFSPAGDFLTSWPVPATSFLGGMNLVVDSTDAIRIKWHGLFEDRLGDAVLVHLRSGGGGFAPDTVVFPPNPIRPEMFIVEGPQRIGLGLPYRPSFYKEWQFAGGIVTAHGQTGVITVAQPGGRVVRVERNVTPVRVTPLERSEREAQLLASAKNVNPDWKGSLPAVPATKPPIVALFSARDGRIWVGVAGEAESIPEAERPQPRAGRPAPAPRTVRDATVWEVYDRNGTFLGRIPFAKNGRLAHASGNDVWVRETTADGFSAIVRYRIEPALN